MKPASFGGDLEWHCFFKQHNVNRLTLDLWNQRYGHAENTLADGGAWHKARVIPNIRGLDFSDVQISGGLGHEAPLIWKEEVGKVVVDPAEQHLTLKNKMDRNDLLLLQSEWTYCDI